MWFALRMWARHVTLIVVASLSLGLGVGATTTIYTLLRGVAHYLTSRGVCADGFDSLSTVCLVAWSNAQVA